MKRALIFNPAFPVLGGGERYTVALGSVIGETHDVTYASTNQPDPDRLDQLGFPPIQVRLLAVPEVSRASVDYDLTVVVTSDVPPPSFSTHSLLVVQFPRGTIAASSRLRRRLAIAKLRRYDRVVYSQFVRRWLIDRWGVDGDVLMPGIEVPHSRGAAKQPMILSVGRFVGDPEQNWTSKRQDALIDAFAMLPPEVRAEWRLVFAGGTSPSPEIDRYVADLRRRAEGLNISFELDVTAARMAELRDQARLFWHASGFERPAAEPEQAEHFGMSTAEAMSNGAIPLVYADGGQIEIVDDRVGRQWRSLPELVEQTAALVALPPSALDAMGDAAHAAGAAFGRTRFESEARALLDRVGARRPERGRAAQAATRAGRRTRWRLYRTAAQAFDRVTRTRRR